MNKLKQLWNSDKKGTAITLVLGLVVIPVSTFIIGGVKLIKDYKDIDESDDRENLY